MAGKKPAHSAKKKGKKAGGKKKKVKEVAIPRKNDGLNSFTAVQKALCITHNAPQALDFAGFKWPNAPKGKKGKKGKKKKK